MGRSKAMAWRKRRLLGWQADVLAGILGAAAVGLWGLWLTREVLAIEERRIVSVSLQSLVENYVTETARQGISEEEARRRTRAYLAAVEAAIASLDDGRTTVLVSEATLGKTVPDATPAVQAAVARALATGAPKEAMDGR